MQFTELENVFKIYIKILDTKIQPRLYLALLYLLEQFYSF